MLPNTQVIAPTSYTAILISHLPFTKVTKKRTHKSLKSCVGFFTRISKERCKCKICPNTEFIINQNTSNHWAHLKIVHPIKFREHKADCNQLGMETFVTKVTSSRLAVMDLILNMIIKVRIFV